ncbi:MAG: hypothetical protein D6820_08390, partial [Lentisphaerae bacterium]
MPSISLKAFLHHSPGTAIEMESRRGDIGRNWWSRQWMELLFACSEDQGMEGKRLARRGSVYFPEIVEDGICFNVQLNKDKSYRVKVIPNSVCEETRRHIWHRIIQDSVLLATLCSGFFDASLESFFDSFAPDFRPVWKRLPEMECQCGNHFIHEDPSAPEHSCCVHQVAVG